MMKLVVGIVSGFLLQGIHGFYIPGVNPHSFSEGDKVKLKVNKMTSTKTQMPYDYYSLPFCEPEGGPVEDNENLGEFLAGDKIQSSPYVLMMKKDMYCEHLCKASLGRPEQSGMSANRVVRAIRAHYHNNWIVDNLSSASKVETDEQITTRYWQGFPVGYISEDTRMAFVHNHVNIEIMYHAVETESDKFRIVRFTVEPFSIKHDVNYDVSEDDIANSYNDPEDPAGGPYLPIAGKIDNPIPSCDRATNKDNTMHTSYDMVVADEREPQPASGDVLFTYDVIWTENENLHWGSRWDIYLSGMTPAKVHWESILFSMVVVVVLSAMIAAILVRNLRRDLARYSKVATDEEKAEDLEEFGWKLVHADVFRPPSTSPMALAVCCGTGAQLLCMAVCTIVISALGFLSPSQRGSLVMAELLLYVLFGGVAGYVTARLYKTFKGKSWQRATMLTALSFPGLAFAFFFVLNIIAWQQSSTDKVPFTTMLVLLVLWFGISTPLVFFGAYFGYKQDAMEFPVDTSSIPRQIPDQPWFMSTPCTLMIGGILPFGSCFVELYYILASVWMEFYYYVFGFLFLVFIILIITCAEITILFTYFQLCSENYQWWWKSFCNAGSTSIYVFLYSILYFSRLEANTPVTYVLYFGYMSLVCIGLFMMMGCIGVLSSLWFNRIIFGSIKID